MRLRMDIRQDIMVMHLTMDLVSIIGRIATTITTPIIMEAGRVIEVGEEGRTGAAITVAGMAEGGIGVGMVGSIFPL